MIRLWYWWHTRVRRCPLCRPWKMLGEPGWEPVATPWHDERRWWDRAQEEE